MQEKVNKYITPKCSISLVKLSKMKPSDMTENTKTCL